MTIPARTAVVAVGGNALLEGGGPATIAEQFDAARRLAPELCRLVADGWRIVLTHGNGPQVGFIMRRSDLVADIEPGLPQLDLDMAVADSQGSLGYILGATLQGELRASGLDRRVVAMLTHTVVDPDDPAIGAPTKPIGSFYVEAVIDKDYASALLARSIGADLLCITTGVDRVAINFGRPDQRALDVLDADEARRHLADGQFPAGSMGPKIEAALGFVESGGAEVLITSPDRLNEALDGTAGTRIVA